MTTELALPQTAAFDRERIDLIKRTIAKGATDDELKLFIEQCKRTRLDPFSRQIYSIRRREYDSDTKEYVERNVTQVGIDGLRVIAERTGKYGGQLGPLWCGADGKWVDVWLSADHPRAATVGIIRTDFAEPIWFTARWESYCAVKKDGSIMGLWVKMPDLMLAKCAEAGGLRKAFPMDTSQLYIAEEMEPINADTGEVLPLNPQQQLPPPVQKQPTLEDYKASAVSRMAKYGVTQKQLEAFLQMDYANWNSPEVRVLRECCRRLKAGEVTPEELFAPRETDNAQSNM